MTDGKMWMSAGNTKEKIQQDLIKSTTNLKQINLKKAVIPDTKIRQSVYGISNNLQINNQQQPKHQRLLQKVIVQGIKTQSKSKLQQLNNFISQKSDKINDDINHLQTQSDQDINRISLNQDFSPQTLANAQSEGMIITSQTPCLTQQSHQSKNSDQTHQTQITQITHITHQTNSQKRLPLTAFGILSQNFGLNNTHNQEQQLLNSSFRGNHPEKNADNNQRKDKQSRDQECNQEQKQFEDNEDLNLNQKYWTAQSQNQNKQSKDRNRQRCKGESGEQVKSIGQIVKGGGGYLRQQSEMESRQYSLNIKAQIDGEVGSNQFNHFREDDEIEETVNISGINPDITSPVQYSRKQEKQFIHQSYFDQLSTQEQQKIINSQLNQQQINSRQNLFSPNKIKRLIPQINYQNQMSNTKQQRIQQLSTTIIEGTILPQINENLGYFDISQIIGTGGSLQTHFHEEDDFDQGSILTDQVSQLNLFNSQANLTNNNKKSRQVSNSVFQHKNQTSPAYNIVGILETRHVKEDSDEDEDILDDDLEPLDANQELVPHITKFNKDLPHFYYERQVQKEVQNSFLVCESQEHPLVAEGVCQQTQDVFYKKQKEQNDFQNLDSNGHFIGTIESSDNIGLNRKQNLKPGKNGNILTISPDKLSLGNNMSGHQIKTEPACQTSYQNYIVGMLPQSAGNQSRVYSIQPNNKLQNYARGSQNYQRRIESGTSGESMKQNNYFNSFPAQAEDDESNISPDDQDQFEDPRHMANSSIANGTNGPVIFVGFSSKKQQQRSINKPNRPIPNAQSAFIPGQTSQTMLMRHRQNQPNYFAQEINSNLSQENFRTDQQVKRNLSQKANADFQVQVVNHVSGASAISGLSELSQLNQGQLHYVPRPQTAQGKHSMFSGAPTQQTINISNVSNSGLQVGAVSSSTSGGLQQNPRDSRLNQDLNSMQKSMFVRQPNRPTLTQEKSQKLIFGIGHQKPSHSQDLFAIAQKNRQSSQQVDMEINQIVDPQSDILVLEDNQSAIIDADKEQLISHKFQHSSFMSAKTNLNQISQDLLQNKGLKIKMKRGVMPISSTPAVIANNKSSILGKGSSGNVSNLTNQYRLVAQSQGKNIIRRPAMSATPNSATNENQNNDQIYYFQMNQLENSAKKMTQKQINEQQRHLSSADQKQLIQQQQQVRITPTQQKNQLHDNKFDYQQINLKRAPQPTNYYQFIQTQLTHQTNQTQPPELTEFMPEIDDADLLKVGEDEEELYYYEDSEIIRENYLYNQEFINNKVLQIKNKPSRVNIKREKIQNRQFQNFEEDEDQVNQEHFMGSVDSGQDFVFQERGDQDYQKIYKNQPSNHYRNKKRHQPSQDQLLRNNFHGESYRSQQALENETFSMQQDTFSKNNKQKPCDGPENPCEDIQLERNQVFANQNQVNFYKNKKYQIYQPQSIQLKSGQRTGAKYLEAIDKSLMINPNDDQQKFDYGNEDDIQENENQQLYDPLQVNDAIFQNQKLNLMQEKVVQQIEQIRQQKKDIKSIKSKLHEEQKLLITKQKILDEKVKNTQKTKNNVKKQGILNKNEAQKLKNLNGKFTELIQSAKLGLKNQQQSKGINHLQEELSGRLSSIQALLELLIHDKKNLRSVIDSSSSDHSSSDSQLINYHSSEKQSKQNIFKRDRQYQSSKQNKKVKKLKDSQSSENQDSDQSQISIDSIEIQSQKEKKNKKDKQIEEQTINLQNVVQSYEVKLQEMSTMMNNLMQFHSLAIPQKIEKQKVQNESQKQNLFEHHQKNESIVSEFIFDPDPNFLLKINQNITKNVVVKSQIGQEIGSQVLVVQEAQIQNEFQDVLQQHAWTDRGQPAELFADHCVQGTQGDFSVYQPCRQTIQTTFEPLNQNFDISNVSQQVRQAINQTELNTDEIQRKFNVGGRDLIVSGFCDTNNAFQGRPILSVESSQSKIPSSQMSVFLGLQQKLQNIQNQQHKSPQGGEQYHGYNIIGNNTNDYSSCYGGEVHSTTNNLYNLTNSIASGTYGLTVASASAMRGHQIHVNNNLQYDEDIVLNGEDEFSMNPTPSPGASIRTNKTTLIQSQVSDHNRKEPLAQISQLIQNINERTDNLRITEQQSVGNFQVGYNPPQSKAYLKISEQLRSQTSRLDIQDSSKVKKIEEDEILRLIHESQEAQEWSESQSFYNSSQTDTFHHRPSGLKLNEQQQFHDIENQVKIELDDQRQTKGQDSSIILNQSGQVFDQPKKGVHGIKKPKNMF